MSVGNADEEKLTMAGRGRYKCDINKPTNIGKANKVCQIYRCSHLMVKRAIFIRRGVVRYEYFRVVPELMADPNYSC
ncbi:hypothetical protein EPO66_03625 [bacterium]|nr:MAG: hypothetical protein EPO66_03625 [bacterium]